MYNTLNGEKEMLHRRKYRGTVEAGNTSFRNKPLQAESNDRSTSFGSLYFYKWKAIDNTSNGCKTGKSFGIKINPNQER